MSFLDRLRHRDPGPETPLGQSMFGNAATGSEGSEHDQARVMALMKVAEEREAGGEPAVMPPRAANIASDLGRRAVEVPEGGGPIKIKPIPDVPRDAFDTAEHFVDAKEKTGQLEAVDPAILAEARANAPAERPRASSS